MTYDDGRITLNVPARMKSALLQASLADDVNLSVWCRNALDKALKERGLNITWPSFRTRGGFRGHRKDKGMDAGNPGE